MHTRSPLEEVEGGSFGMRPTYVIRRSSLLFRSDHAAVGAALEGLHERGAKAPHVLSCDTEEDGPVIDIITSEGPSGLPVWTHRIFRVAVDDE